MRFYGRESELKVLKDTAELSKTTSQFTVILGRRRIGKTTTMLKALEGTRSVYLFVSRKEEGVLCADLQNAVAASGVDIPGEVRRFPDLLKALMLYSRHEPLTVMIDEFQNLTRVNPSVFGGIQEVWDTLKDTARINLVISGSVHSMMVRIFEDEDEPLFGRPTRKLSMGPFAISEIRHILEDHDPLASHRDMLTLYMLTGGVPSYVEVLMDAGATTHEKMLDFALSPGSVFLREGEDLMTSEFGKEGRTYRSILQMMASGVNRRSELENRLDVTLGEYLSRMEDECDLITRRIPVLSGDRKAMRWSVSDMYLAFYFRYIQPNESFVQSGRTDLLRRVVEADLESYEGRVLESYFTKRISEEGTYTSLGSHWSRDGRIEIDIVVLDSISGNAELIEVKRNPDKLDLKLLERRAEELSGLLKGYEVTCRGLSMDDV